MVLNRLERRANEHHNLGCERVISLPRYGCGVQKNCKKAHKSIKLNKNGSTVPAMANHITKYICITKASTDRVLSMLNETAEKIASKIWQ